MGELGFHNVFEITGFVRVLPRKKRKKWGKRRIKTQVFFLSSEAFAGNRLNLLSYQVFGARQVITKMDRTIFQNKALNFLYLFPSRAKSMQDGVPCRQFNGIAVFDLCNHRVLLVVHRSRGAIHFLKRSSSDT